MHSNIRFAALAAIVLSVIPSFSQDQALAKSLEKKLKGGVLSLRRASSSNDLRFSSEGTPLGKQEHGVASMDRDLIVDRVTINDRELRVKGTRLYYSWNLATKRLEGSKQKATVDIRIELPAKIGSEADVIKPFYNTFLTSKELAATACTADELSKTLETFSKMGSAAQPESPIDERPEAKSVADLTEYCLPPGQRAYRMTKGTTNPKAIHTVDPTYSEAARQAKIQGTAIYLVRVDEQGLISNVLLIRPLNPSLNYNGAVAIRNWTFQPASIGGTAIPAIINVEMNFRLY